MFDDDKSVMKMIFLARALSVGTEKAIEEKEAEGHSKVERKERLPLDLNGSKQEDYEKAGFVFGDPINSIFRSVTFPEGWRVQRTGHAMWSDILDTRGFVRGNIFYKSYDEKAHTDLNRRLYLIPDYHEDTREFLGYHLECAMPKGQPAKSLAEFPASKGETTFYLGEGHAAGTKYLEENFPDYKDPGSYWDLEF